MWLSSAVAVVMATPELAVLIGGSAWLLVWRRRLPRHAAVLAVVGCGLMLATSLLQLGWWLMLPMLVEQGAFELSNLPLATTATSAVFGLVYVVALALLIGAVLVCRGPRQAPADGFSPLVAGQSTTPVGGWPASPVPTQPSGPPGFAPPSGSPGFAPPGSPVPDAADPGHRSWPAG